jgi:hypothetical protein
MRSYRNGQMLVCRGAAARSRRSGRTMGRDHVEVPEQANFEEATAREHIEDSNSRSVALEAAEPPAHQSESRPCAPSSRQSLASPQAVLAC